MGTADALNRGYKDVAIAPIRIVLIRIVLIRIVPVSMMNSYRLV